jgi:hypothetical protein
MKKPSFIFLVIAIVSATSLGAPAQGTATPAWLNYVGTGVGGSFSCTSGICSLGDERWFTSFNVSAGATVVALANNGPTIVRSTGTCNIAGAVSNSVNTANGGGVLNEGDFGGGGGGGGGGTLAARGGLLSVGPGGLPIVNSGAKGAANGGAGGNAQSTTTGQFHELLSVGSFWPIGGGTGGPGGGNGSGAAGGQGGNGGGAVIFVCNTINFTGTIDVSGAAGSAAPADNTGAGGGGGGGYVILSAVNFTANTGTINVNGGPGGSCSGHANCGAGGTGGNGWSYFQTIQ